MRRQILSCLVFPHVSPLENDLRQPSFDGELMISKKHLPIRAGSIVYTYKRVVPAVCTTIMDDKL